MNSIEPSQNRRLFWAAAGLASVATAALPFLALAWWRTWLMHDDFGMEVSPLVQWFSDRQLPVFLVVGLACVAADAMLYLSGGHRKATYVAIALAAFAVAAEATIAVRCIILPIAGLFRGLA